MPVEPTWGLVAIAAGVGVIVGALLAARAARALVVVLIVGVLVVLSFVVVAQLYRSLVLGAS